MSDSKKVNRHYLDEGSGKIGKGKKRGYSSRPRWEEDDEKFNWNEISKKINLESDKDDKIIIEE